MLPPYMRPNWREIYVQHILINVTVGIQSWHRLRGEGTAPAVVFTHGAGADHKMFDQLEESVRAAGFTTLVWDVPGHGSSPSLGWFSIEAASDVLLDLLAQCGIIEPVVLVGQSMGGNIAQHLAMEHPEKCVALAVIGSTSNTLPISFGERIQLRLADPILRMIPQRLLVPTMAKASALTEPARRYLHNTFERTGRRNFLRIWHGVTQAVKPRPNYQATLPQLVIVGDEDKTGNIQTAGRRWVERDPQARLAVIKDAGHTTQLDQPEIVAGELLAFLKEVTS